MSQLKSWDAFCWTCLACDNTLDIGWLTHWPMGDLNIIFKNVIFNLALLIGIFKSSYDKVLRWMPQDHTDDKSTLVHVMAWCRQATSHYLNQCWPRWPTPYGVTRPQWVKCLLSISNADMFYLTCQSCQFSLIIYLSLKDWFHFSFHYNRTVVNMEQIQVTCSFIGRRRFQLWVSLTGPWLFVPPGWPLGKKLILEMTK